MARVRARILGYILSVKLARVRNRVRDSKTWLRQILYYVALCVDWNSIIVIIVIITTMGLRSLSASKGVIGDPSCPGTNNSELSEPRREEREKVLGKRCSFHFNLTAKNNYGL